MCSKVSKAIWAEFPPPVHRYTGTGQVPVMMGVGTTLMIDRYRYIGHAQGAENNFRAVCRARTTRTVGATADCAGPISAQAMARNAHTMDITLRCIWVGTGL